MSQVARLSVLAVSPVAEAGGAENLLLDVLAGLQGAGVGVTLVALGNGPLCELARSRGVTVLTGPPLSFRSPRSIVGAMVAVRRAVSTACPDVVLASHPKGQVISRLATVRERSLGHVTQLYDPPRSGSPSTCIAARLPGPRLSITEETAAAYRRLNARLDPVVIRPGTDLQRLRHDALCGNGDDAWVRAGLDGAGPRVVMMGRLQRFKGPFDLLTVAAFVAQSRPDARFLIIGPDSPVEPGLRREIEAAIVNKNLSGSVAVIGRLPAADLAATVAGATVLLHPAHREPFGLAVLEALALGTPVISYATTGPAMILQHGGGAVVPVGDVKALGDSVLRAMSNPSTLTRWSAETALTASRFDLATSVARYLDVLTQAAPPVARSVCAD